jgi:hypothetical protein
MSERLTYIQALALSALCEYAIPATIDPVRREGDLEEKNPPSTVICAEKAKLYTRDKPIPTDCAAIDGSYCPLRFSTDYLVSLRRRIQASHE